MTIETQVKQILDIVTAQNTAIASLATAVANGQGGDNTAVLAAIAKLQTATDAIGASTTDIQAQVDEPAATAPDAPASGGTDAPAA